MLPRTLNEIMVTAAKFKSRLKLKNELMDLVSYVYMRKNIPDTLPPSLIRRRTWLNLIEMRRAELDREAKEQRYKQSKLGAFKAKPDPMLQAVDDWDEANFYLSKLGKKLRSLVMLIWYHGVQVQTISTCAGKSRFHVHRQIKTAIQIMKE